MKEQQKYSIGETSMITGIPSTTLRYYDSLGLITPTIRNPQNNYRYYSQNQLITLLVIQRLRTMNCDLNTIRSILNEKSLEAMCDQIESKIKDIEKTIDDYSKIIHENKEFLCRLRESIQLKKENINRKLLENIRIEQIPASCLFFEQKVMPNYNVCNTSVNFRVELYKKCKKKRLQIIGPEVTTYFTHMLGQFTMHDCKIEIGITVNYAPNVKKLKKFGNFLAATITHIGSYDTMVNTHIRLLQWICNHNYEVNGYVSEQFLISPIDILEQKDQVIKVIIPVRKGV